MALTDVKQAVVTAKKYLEDVFGSELMTPPRLEEVWFDDRTDVWNVTFGFFRKPDDITSAMGTYSTYAYKVVAIDDETGNPVSIRDRERIQA